MQESAAELQPAAAAGAADVVPLGDVVPLRPHAHAQEWTGGGGVALNHHHHHHDRRAAFDAMMRPLEEASGFPLYDPDRSTCFAAFCTYPENVARHATEVLRVGRSPVSLFVWRIKEGRHEKGAPKAETAAERELRRPPAARPFDDCAQCGKRTTIVDLDRYACEECTAA
jgi:hypothetical protein